MYYSLESKFIFRSYFQPSSVSFVQKKSVHLKDTVISAKKIRTIKPSKFNNCQTKKHIKNTSMLTI